MSRLLTHDLTDLIAINTTSGVQRGKSWTMHADVVPGEPVYHKDDSSSYGMCLSRRWGPNDKPMQCEVLWSKVPKTIDINVQSIPVSATSRKLRAKWSPQVAEDYMTESEFFNKYGSFDALLKAEPDVTDLITHQDGKGEPRIEIKRRAPTPDYDIVHGRDGTLSFRSRARRG